MERAPEGLKSKNPYILFELTKVEGMGDGDIEDLMRPSALTEAERADFSSICAFRPDFHPDALEPGELPQDLKIESYEIMYNSIIHGDGSFEFDVEGDEIRGSAVLVVRYNLNKSVDVHAFYTAVEQSRVRVEPSESEGWYWEDHNGYSRPVTPRDVGELMYELDLPRRGTPIPWPADYE